MKRRCVSSTNLRRSAVPLGILPLPVMIGNAVDLQQTFSRVSYNASPSCIGAGTIQIHAVCVPLVLGATVDDARICTCCMFESPLVSSLALARNPRVVHRQDNPVLNASLSAHRLSPSLASLDEQHIDNYSNRAPGRRSSSGRAGARAVMSSSSSLSSHIWMHVELEVVFAHLSAGALPNTTLAGCLAPAGLASRSARHPLLLGSASVNPLMMTRLIRAWAARSGSVLRAALVTKPFGSTVASHRQIVLRSVALIMAAFDLLA